MPNNQSGEEKNSIEVFDERALKFFQKITNYFEQWTGTSIMYVAQFFFVVFLLGEGLHFIAHFRQGDWFFELLFFPITFFFVYVNLKILHERMREEKREGMLSILEVYLKRIRETTLRFLPLLVLFVLTESADKKLAETVKNDPPMIAWMFKHSLLLKWPSLVLFFYFLSCKSNPPKTGRIKEKLKKLFERNPSLSTAGA